MSKHESWKDNRMSEQGSDDIPVDEFYSDYSDGESYRTVASTVLDYQYYHGRRYHAYSAGGSSHCFRAKTLSRLTLFSLSLPE